MSDMIKVTYLSEIVSVLKELNGVGSLAEINRMIEKRKMLPAIQTNPKWTFNVSAELQRHCSDTKSYRGGTDLFYSVYGLGGGVWGLKSEKKYIENYETGPYEARLIEKVENDNTILETEKLEIVLSRKGQGVFRRKILNHFPKCIITGIETTSLLIASHIKPWRDANNAERLSEDNGITLSPLYDRLFDLGFITFDFKTTSLLISQSLSNADIEKCAFDTSRPFILNCTPTMRSNLEYHNEMVFRK